MKQVGHRRMVEASVHGDAQTLRSGLAMNDSFASFGWTQSTGQRKGVYRFKTFEAMEAHRLECLAQAMAARGRLK